MELKIVSDIPVSSTDKDSFVPASGKRVAIKEFSADIPGSVDVVVRLIWDFEGAAEETIWNIRRTGKMPRSCEISSTNTDGIKKLGIIVENNDPTSPQAVSVILRTLEK